MISLNRLDISGIVSFSFFFFKERRGIRKSDDGKKK